MMACYEQVMLEIGTSKGLFEKHFALESCLTTKCCLVLAWEGVSKFGIDVSLPLSAEIPLQRGNDQLLMDLVLKQGLSKPRRKAFNRVHVYLRVLLLADISTRNGMYIRPEFLSVI